MVPRPGGNCRDPDQVRQYGETATSVTRVTPDSHSAFLCYCFHTAEGQRAVRISFAILALAPLLAACPAPVTLDVGRLGETYLADTADPGSYQIMEAGEALDDCGLPNSIGKDQSGVEIVDSDLFWRTAFPDPVPSSTIQAVLADPDISQRLAELDVEYLVAVGGESVATDMNGSMSCSLQGCAGALWNQEWTDLEATVWNLDTDAPVDSIVAKGSAKTVMAAFIVPVIWLEPYTRSTTCRNLGREIGSVVAEQNDRGVVQIALVGVSGSAFQRIDSDDLDDLLELAEDGDADALYDLAVYFQQVGDWDTIPRWQTEVLFRLAMVTNGEDRWTWLCQAANAGHAAAQAQAGWAAEADYYTDGTVPTDLTEAYKWYRLALLNGEISAAADMDRLEASLTAEQVAEAERRASDWRPGPCGTELLG